MKGSLIAGTLAAIGASVCCVGPLVLLMLGVGGAWIGNLTALEPYRPIFSALTLLFFTIAFWNLYFTKRVCTVDECADDLALRRQRRIFWLVAVPVALLLTFPLYAPLLF